MKPNRVRAIAICLFQHGDKLLAAEFYDEVKHQTFYRPLGGTIEFGEYSAQTIVREIREELGAEVIDVRYLFTLENVFTFNGQTGHEIVLVYDGEFTDPTLYRREQLEAREDNGQPFMARWIALDTFGGAASGGPPLYPSGLLERLMPSLSQGESTSGGTRATPPRLTRAQYEQLEAQYEQTPELSNSVDEPGEHWTLIGLLNELGYSPHSREEALRMAQGLLDEGYQEP
jgi:8-oxo-dGTP pyrophosphatase MutT (NUDIX family)